MKNTTLAVFGFVISAAFVSTGVQAETFTSTSTLRPSAAADSGNLGLGLMMGEPSGITAKYWLSDMHAVDGGFALSLSNYTGLFGDFLWHAPLTFENPEFVPYFGVGAIALFNNDSSNGRGFFVTDRSRHSLAFGIRIPLGLEYLPKKAPLGLFAEIVPGIGLIPGLFGLIEASTGARYYF